MLLEDFFIEINAKIKSALHLNKIMASGFGRKHYNITLQSVDLFGIRKKIQVAIIGKGRYVEVKSASIALEKDPQHLCNWASRSNIELKRCTVTGSGSSVFCMAVEDYIEFITSERENDNPFAQQIIQRCGLYGINSLIQTAIASGQDFIEINSQRVRFHIIEGKPYINQGDLAAVLGVTVEQLEQEINSEDFQRFYRSNKGWV